MTITSIQSTERAQVIAPAATQAAQASQTSQDSGFSSATGYYFSPVLKIDPATQSVVIQYRNAETGAVTNQYPSEKELKAYASQQKLIDTQDQQDSLKSAAVAQTATQPAPTAIVSAVAVKPAAAAGTAATANTATTGSKTTAPTNSIVI
jgi:hypothetical protein